MNASSEAYLFYEAGQAVAAAHLGLRITLVNANPIDNPTDIAVPKRNPKAQIILWLTGLAAERRGTGRSHPLRRTRNKLRIRALADAYATSFPGTAAKKNAARKSLMSQAQDRANAITVNLFAAIEEIAQLLRNGTSVPGSQVNEIVARVKAERRARGDAETPEDPTLADEN